MTTFEFFLLVETQTPAETSILHFRPENGSPVFYSTLYGVFAATAHDVFAVTDGAVLHYDGNYWRAMDAGACGCTSQLFAVWGSDGRDVYAVGGSGLVAHWTGTTWNEVDTGYGGLDLYAVWGSSAGDVWAVGDGGRMIHFDGVGWTNDGPAGFETPLYGVWGSAPHDVWAVGEAGAILHYDGAWSADTHDVEGRHLQRRVGHRPRRRVGRGLGAGHPGNGNGEPCPATASPLPQRRHRSLERRCPSSTASRGLYSGWSSGPGDAWVTSGGDVLHWDGAAWTRQLVDDAGIPLYGITGTGATDVFAVGDLGAIAHSTGGAWTDMAFPGFGSDLLAVGLVGRRRVGRGRRLPAAPHRQRHLDRTDIAPDFAQLNAVWGASAGDVWAAGELGTVVHYDGADWSTVHVDSALTLNALWGASASDVWAAGSDGAVLHWDGAAWTTSAAGSETHYALWGSGAGNVIAVGANGSIQRWDGGGWTAMVSGTGQTLLAVWGSGPGDVWAAGTDSTVLHYDGNPSLHLDPAHPHARGRAGVRHLGLGPRRRVHAGQLRARPHALGRHRLEDDVALLGQRRRAHVHAVGHGPAQPLRRRRRRRRDARPALTATQTAEDDPSSPRPLGSASARLRREEDCGSMNAYRAVRGTEAGRSAVRRRAPVLPCAHCTNTSGSGG